MLLGLPQGNAEQLNEQNQFFFFRSFTMPNFVLCFCQEVGILLGSLVEKILSESKADVCLLTKEDLTRASKVFENLLLKCRHWVSYVNSHKFQINM